MREPSTSSPDAATPRPAGPGSEYLRALDDGIVVVPRDEVAAVANRIRLIHEREKQVKKALAAGQTIVDIMGLRAKLPQ